LLESDGRPLRGFVILALVWDDVGGCDVDLAQADFIGL
jgi:hypothetical protein